MDFILSGKQMNRSNAYPILSVLVKFLFTDQSLQNKIFVTECKANLPYADRPTSAYNFDVIEWKGYRPTDRGADGQAK